MGIIEGKTKRETKDRGLKPVFNGSGSYNARMDSTGFFFAGVAELADAQDLKSCGTNLPYRFDSGRRH